MILVDQPAEHVPPVDAPGADRHQILGAVQRLDFELHRFASGGQHEEGADAVAFDPIVAGGPNAAVPHHHPGERPIGPNETVIVDAGATVDGYRSDCTRTFATGELSDELGQAYDL